MSFFLIEPLFDLKWCQWDNKKKIPFIRPSTHTVLLHLLLHSVLFRATTLLKILLIMQVCRRSRWLSLKWNNKDDVAASTSTVEINSGVSTCLTDNQFVWLLLAFVFFLFSFSPVALTEMRNSWLPGGCRGEYERIDCAELWQSTTATIASHSPSSWRWLLCLCSTSAWCK